MKNRIYLKVIALGIGLIGISALLFFVFGLIEGTLDKTENNLLSEQAAQTGTSGNDLYYESVWYRPRSSLESYLLLGIDKSLDGSDDRQHSEQADFLALLLLDKQQETFSILHLNRDTMTEIPQLDITGKEYGTIRAQLTLAHTYGKDDRGRCRNTVTTVERLLYGIDVQHYISLTMDAIPILNDRLGGVELTLMDDFTHVEESFVKGATVTLHGDQALAYVRARGSLEDTSNLHRMERQQQYVSALLDQFGGAELELGTDTLLDISEYMVSDCTVDQLSRLLERLESYSYEGMRTLEGEAVKGDEFMEYYIDESAAQATVVELFYEPRKE